MIKLKDILQEQMYNPGIIGTELSKQVGKLKNSKMKNGSTNISWVFLNFIFLFSF